MPSLDGEEALMSTIRLCAAAVLAGALATSIAIVHADPIGIPKLDHVFVIVMENHAYAQIVGNPDAPFANALFHSANVADDYFAIGHPSLTNYLEIVGGSNFGVLSDNSPDWHNGVCHPNIATGIPSTDVPSTPNICPIGGNGTDAQTVAIDTVNEVTPPSILAVTNIDGVTSIAAAPTTGKMIGDQLVEHGKTWKSYQESLPPSGADGVNYSDGFFTDATDIDAVLPGAGQSLLKNYAAKHNPFVYFRSVQRGLNPANSLANIVGFDGPNGLYDDLASGRVPSLSFIAPNQCNDQHGRGNGGSGCAFDPNTTGTTDGLNRALIYIGDVKLRTVVNAIHNSPAWQRGHNAIVIVWDENDYSATPITNQVLLIVDENHGSGGVHSPNRYTHFSLLKSLEAGFGLPCLNHACDGSVDVMSDLFGH
jgi:hypothetical protein